MLSVSAADAEQAVCLGKFSRSLFKLLVLHENIDADRKSREYRHDRVHHKQKCCEGLASGVAYAERKYLAEYYYENSNQHCPEKNFKQNAPQM